MGEKIAVYDLLLVIALVGAAWKALFGRDAFTATVFYVAYGLFMAMAWVQLGAIDVALAEACVGAGLTGALLIGAIRQFDRDRDIGGPVGVGWGRSVVGILTILVLIGLVTSLNKMNEPVHTIPTLVEESLDVSGSTHPVTAVLLNFRAFDTWLELGVLLLASVAAIAIHKIYDSRPIPEELSPAQEQPQVAARMMLPLLVVLGGVLLWFGSRAPGGAFQAGALIGAAGILLQIAGEQSFLRVSSIRTRFLLLMGFVTFLAIATLTFSLGRRILEYSPASAATMILTLELAATVSIALTLNVVYACSHPWGAAK